MKALVIIFAVALCACETVTDDEGRTTTRFDAKAATEAVDIGFRSYDRYRAYNQPYTAPAYVPPAYPVYPTYPVY